MNKPHRYYLNIAREAMMMFDNDRHSASTYAISMSSLDDDDVREVVSIIDIHCFPGSCICSYEEE